MMDSEDFNSVVKSLKSSRPKSMLRVIWRDPTGDERVLPYLRELLNDWTPCMIGVKPITYGEIRYLAGQALNAEYKKLERSERANFLGFVFPLRAGMLMNLAEDAKVSLQKKSVVEDSDQNLINAFEKLRDMGKLILCDEAGYPINYLSSAS